MLNGLRTFVVLWFVSLVTSKPGVLKQIQYLENSNSPLLRYPTQYTQDIVPKYIHSHNDYWREVPLLTALSNGVSSVEADVWLVNGTLYVGHEQQALTTSRTFASLYVQPILSILQGQNPQTPFTGNEISKNGVWDTDSGRILQLLVDMKTDGIATLPYVVSALQPLRDRGYLTTFENGTLTVGPLTVVGTGNTPLDGIKNLTRRDVFYDAPLTDLTSTPDTTWNVSLSPLASTDYGAVGWDGLSPITTDQQSTILKLVQTANSMGIRARFWDTPGWPIEARNNIWKTLLMSGDIWLNADDLEAASQF
ncbi:hypothetical protein AX15_004323 [Amanita polypyramis BW_CC]|nr:hypothetical protein AX15_004323 [Amanita polypyramis BW_CC]